MAPFLSALFPSFPPFSWLTMVALRSKCGKVYFPEVHTFTNVSVLYQITKFKQNIVNT